MKHTSGLGFCGWLCWLLGLIGGIFAYSMSRDAVGPFAAVLVGLAVGIFVGLVLSALFCKTSAQVVETAPQTSKSTAPVAATAGTAVATSKDDDGRVAARAAEEKRTEEAVASKASKASAQQVAAKKPAATKAPAKKTTAKSGATKASTATKATEAKPAKAAAKPAARKTAKEATPTKAKAAGTAAKAKAAPAAKLPAKETAKAAAKPAGEKKPRTMKAARKAGADDLKLISGVGPKLEQTLNELGFWHFDQIAKWGADEIAWVDARLRFKGRIERDDWMAQAKVLAAGGETEFSKKSKKA